MKIAWQKAVADYGYKCSRCGTLVFDKDKNQPVNAHQAKGGLFDEVNVLRCRRCGDAVAKVEEN